MLSVYHDSLRLFTGLPVSIYSRLVRLGLHVDFHYPAWKPLDLRAKHNATRLFVPVDSSALRLRSPPSLGRFTLASNAVYLRAGTKIYLKKQQTNKQQQTNKINRKI